MERYAKLCRELEKAEIDLALLTTPCNVTYATGFDVPYYKSYMETVAKDAPMAAALVCVGEERGRMIACDFYRKKIERCPQIINPLFYSVYDAFEDVNPYTGLVDAVKKALKETTGMEGRGSIGLELQTCPAGVYEMIRTEFPKLRVKDVSPSLYAARKIKTAEEIHLLRQAAKVMDVAQNTLLVIADSDGSRLYTEFDIWAEVQRAVNVYSGELLPFVGELVTGPDTGLSDYPLGPRGRIVQKGDAGIMDVCPRLNGYWADTCNSVVFYTERSGEQQKYFKAVKAAFDAAAAALIPGNRCSDVEAAARKAFESYGFGPISYIGHEIGVEVNETPRLTCYDHTVIEPGMVFCVEPQQYTGNTGATGVRLEKTILVTEQGPEILNQFRWG